MRNFKMLGCLVSVLLVFAVWGGNASANLRAVATFSVLADFIQQVGGDKVSVTSIIPLGGDPHSWEPTPREARSIASADVLFYNGLGLELWVDRLISNAARPDLPIVVLSAGLTPLPGPTFTNHAHDEGDPHFWLSVRYAMDYVKKIQQSLKELDPKNAQYYDENAQRYLDKLMELDAWLFQQVELIPKDNRQIITYHDGFRYLADQYGFDVVGFLVVNPDREPSSRDMAQLVRLLAALPRKVIFTEPQISGGSRYAQAVAQEVDGKVYTLYSDSLSEAVPSYIAMMRHNGRVLVEALQ